MVLLTYLINSNKNDGFLINTAGKQRYLSQKITKTNILLLETTNSSKEKEYIQVLEDDLLLYKTNNEILLANAISETIEQQLDDLQKYYKVIYFNSKKIVKHKNQALLKQILITEPIFLKKMDRIVFQYEKEDKAKIDDLLYFILSANIALILVLVALIFKVIKPTIINNFRSQNIIQRKNDQLQQLNKSLEENNKSLDDLNKTKDKFFGIIAHDLKNPFNSLIGLSELLVKNVSDYSLEEIKQYSQYINNTTSQTYKLLQNLLDWSNLQTGKLNPKPVKITPVEVIYEVKLLTEQVAKAKNIKLQVKLDSNDLILADREMIYTVLRNLVSNAIKFTNPGGSVKIKTENFEDNVLFTVSDSGIGIKQGDLVKLFIIDNKLSKLGTNGEKGTGLGLLLCKEFVEKNNGEIWVESEIGKGSSFKFTLKTVEMFNTSCD